MRSAKIVKAQFRKSCAISEYTTSEAMRSLFQEFERKRVLPLFDILRILLRGEVDSISFTKDTPYFYFYCRSNGKEVLIKLNDLQKEIEIPTSREVLEDIVNMQNKT